MNSNINMKLSFNDILQSLMVVFIGWTALNTHQMKISQAVTENEIEHNRVEHVEFIEEDAKLNKRVGDVEAKASTLDTRVSILCIQLDAIKEENELKVVEEE